MRRPRLLKTPGWPTYFLPLLSCLHFFDTPRLLFPAKHHRALPRAGFSKSPPLLTILGLEQSPIPLLPPLPRFFLSGDWKPKKNDLCALSFRGSLLTVPHPPFHLSIFLQEVRCPPLTSFLRRPISVNPRFCGVDLWTPNSSSFHVCPDDLVCFPRFSPPLELKYSPSSDQGIP